MNEVLDRQMTAKNVMIFNFEVIDAKTQVGDIINEIYDRPVTMYSFEKMGKPNRNGRKTFQVVLGENAYVRLVSRNRARAADEKQICINTYLTPKQRSTLGSIKCE